MAANDDTASMPFIKHLASSDRRVRDDALSTLRAFLSGTRRLGPTDNLKLWKGLFYSLWMCDRPVPQQKLCAELAGLARALPSDAAVRPWLEAFWATVAREWTTGIDVLRMEKFLLLVRRVFGASLEWVVEGLGRERGRQGKKRKRSKSSDGRSRKNEDEENDDALDRMEEMLSVFSAWPFEKTGDLSKVPVGLRLHVLDIWVDEAEKLDLWPRDDAEEEEEEEEEDAKEGNKRKNKNKNRRKNGEEGREEEKLQFLDRIWEVVEVQTKSACKPVRARAKESLADERLPWNKAEEESGDDEDLEMAKDAPGDKDSWDGFED
ncbi:nucleolar protein,Nop52-domain-containing protein [Biscogniauxia marginata]|nr:nucleolar protein,Nop52-domain-containing protein [Biscogniauxia marginata]